MCECFAYEDGSQHTCEACVPLNEYAHERVKELEAALREIADCICRRNWYSGGRSFDCLDITTVVPCASCIARRAIAGGGK